MRTRYKAGSIMPMKIGVVLSLVFLICPTDGFSQSARDINKKGREDSAPEHILARPGVVLEDPAPALHNLNDGAEEFPELHSLARERKWAELENKAQSLLAVSDEPFLRYWLGIAHLQRNDFVHAAIELRKAERLGMDAAILSKALGIAYYGLRQYTLFRKQMEKAIKADPQNGEPYHYLGRYHELDLNDFSTALSYFDQALARNSEDVKSCHFRAVCLEMLDRRVEAEQAYRTAIKMVERQGKPYSWPYERLALLLLGRDPELALPLAQRAVDLEPSRVENRLVLAKTYENLDRPRDALPVLQEAVRQKPNQRSIRYVLFRIYRKLGRPEEAARELAMHEKLKAVYGTSQQ